MAEKKCVWCGEVYRDDLLFNYMIKSPNGDTDTTEACSDCIATWFSETPEDVEIMTIWRA